MSRPGSRFHARLSSARWERTRRRELERAGWRCEKCGLASRMEVHHRRPLHRGGDPWAGDNLEVLCRGCHIRIHARQLSEPERAWRDLVRGMVDSL